MTRGRFVYLTLGFCIGISGTSKGRGQTQMTPQTPPPGKAPVPAALPVGDDHKVKDDEELVEEKKPEKIEPSEFSKKIADRLSVFSGMNYTKISGSSGSWTAGLSGDFGVGYKFAKDVFAGGSGTATFRYSPADVTVTDKQQSYQGVVEIYQFGAAWTTLMGSWEVLGSAELGYVNISLSTTDDGKEDSGLESGAVNFTLGGGGDKVITPKLRAGPRLYVGFGAVTTYQLGGALAFIF